jgi:hypothetical protein
VVAVVVVISLRGDVHGYLTEAWHEMPINVNHDLDRAVVGWLLVLAADEGKACLRLAPRIDAIGLASPVVAPFRRSRWPGSRLGWRPGPRIVEALGLDEVVVEADVCRLRREPARV